MKRLKVLALCAVLAGLGGAVSAQTTMPDIELEVFFPEAWASASGQMTRSEFVKMFTDQGTDTATANEYADKIEEMYGKEYWKSGSSSSAPDAIPGLQSLSQLKAGNSHVTLVAPASQSGLVSEVDDYMDVNGFQGVQFDKLFTHVGYNINNQFNAGLATRLGKVYVGGFFYGNFIDSTTTISKEKKSKTTTTTTDVSSSSSGSGSDFPWSGGDYDDDDDESSLDGSGYPSWGGYDDYTSLYALDDSSSYERQVFQLSTLIGIGNLGIKPSVLFSPKTGNGSYKDVYDGNTEKTTKSYYEIYPQIEVGYNLAIDSLVLTPHAYLGFDFDVDKKTYKDSDGNKMVTGYSTTWTMLGLGTGLELPRKDGSIVTNSFSLDLDLAFRSAETMYYYDGEDNKTEKDKSGYTHGLFTLGWTGKFVPADNVSFKLASTLPIEWAVAKYGDQKWNRNSATEIAPTFTASVKYQATERLALGISADLGLPALEFASAGAGDYKDSSVRFNTEDHLKLEFDAGFRFDFTQNVTLDCGWSFGGNLFNNYFKTVSDNGYTFWSGLSYIFSDIQMGLSVKL